MATLLKHTFLAMIFIASTATLASATSSYWWRGSAGLAWAIVAFLEFVSVYVTVYIACLLERRGNAEGDDGDDRHFPTNDGLVLLIVVGVAALAGSRLERLETPWQYVTVAALVSIVVTFGAFYGTLLREDSGAGGDGWD